jgi:hypothetical protein
MFWRHFSTVKVVHKFWEKHLLGHIFDDYSQTHLVALAPTWRLGANFSLGTNIRLKNSSQAAWAECAGVLDPGRTPRRGSRTPNPVSSSHGPTSFDLPPLWYAKLTLQMSWILTSLLWKVELGIRVARWFVFKQKIQIWVNFVGALEWKALVWFLWSFGIFYGHLLYFMAIWFFCM